MIHPLLQPSSAARALRALIVVGLVACPASALAAKAPKPRHRSPPTAVGALVQLRGPGGCLVDRSAPARGCTSVRALRGPAPFLGSNAVAISPDGRNVYVASSSSNAVAIFRRDAATGALTQAVGTAGCIAQAGAGGCANAVGLEGPNSLAVSPDGSNVYATSVTSDAVAILHRDPSTGALTQAGDGSGCIANAATTGCTTGRALDGPDIVVVSPDDRNVYVGAFMGNAIAVFARDASTGALTQPAGPPGCLVAVPTPGCVNARGLGAPEGLAVSADGDNVYAAAALSSALDVFTRAPITGALTQASNGTGCIVDAALSGCTTGTQLDGADAVAVSPDDGDVYVTSLFSNSLTTFTRTPTTGQLVQQSGTSACVIYVFAVGCSLGRALSAPEGLAVSPDGASVYAAAFASAAIDSFNRKGESGALMQKSGRTGCVTTIAAPGCAARRGLLGASSIAVSADGRFVYTAAFASNAVDVFKRATKPAPASGSRKGRK